MLTRRAWTWVAVIGLLCGGSIAAAGERLEKPQRSQDNAAEKWQELRKQRIRENEKGNASEFAGKWKMRLPAGFEYTVVLKQTEEGLLRMTCDGHALVLLGDFACKENELRLVVTHHSAIDDFVWTYHNGKFILTTDEQGHGGNYLRAVLTRVP